ncbi:MAG: glycosyltransferase [Lachnospiraceae bacterium]|nr:glycosyltransferase [Lachnospiraceae bacterium]
MRTTVVLTTYNGEKYLLELIESLRKQTHKPDEVLIFDDCSTDATINILEKYIDKNKLEHWIVKKNDKNVGWERNFANALMCATGDVIFPADQDDIWHIDKIEQMLKIFNEYNEVWMVVSSFHAFCTGKGINEIVHKVVTENKEISGKVKFDKAYYQILRPGCTMAISKKMLPIFKQLWSLGTPHDALLWAIASITGKLYLCDKVLIEYRRHDNNASRNISHELKYKINEIERTKRVNEWYETSQYFDSNHTKIISDVDKWCYYRHKLLIEKRFIYWIPLFKFRKYYLTPKKYVGDLFYYILVLKKGFGNDK